MEEKEVNSVTAKARMGFVQVHLLKYKSLQFCSSWKLVLGAAVGMVSSYRSMGLEDSKVEVVCEEIATESVVAKTTQKAASKELQIVVHKHTRELSMDATDDDEEDEEGKIELGPIKEQLEKDQDDESLRRWKEQLLGSIDLNSVGETLEPGIKIKRLAIKSPGREDIVLSVLENGDPKGSWFTLKEGSRYNLLFTFRVSNNIVSGLGYTNTVWKTGVKVDRTKEMLGTFSPRAEPYSHEMAEETIPCGMFARAC